MITPRTSWFVFLRIGVIGAVLASSAVASAQVRFDVLGRIPSPTTLMEARDGSFYVTTGQISPTSCSGLFRFSRVGTVIPIHEFSIEEGCNLRHLVERADGVFYGTTGGLGTGFGGSVFSITADGKFTILHRFTGAADGALPNELLLARDGNLYGTTARAYTVPPSRATLFKIGPSDEFVTIATFDGVVNGSPIGALAETSEGVFYGTTFDGGPSLSGSVYRATAAGELTMIADLVALQGRGPVGLTLGPDGNLYGMTVDGGAFDKGSIIRVGLDGTVAVVYSFPSAPSHYKSALMNGGDGFLYGAANDTLFRTTLDGGLTELHRFGPDGVAPAAGPGAELLLKSSDGYIWGVSFSDGVHKSGIYRLWSQSVRVAIDTPSPRQVVNEPFLLTGWAIDESGELRTGIDMVHVWAYPADGSAPLFMGATGYGIQRQDIAAHYGSNFINSGFSLQVRSLPTGTYTLVASPHSEVWNAFDYARAASVVLTISSVQSVQPRISIDAPGNQMSVTLPFHVSGSAIDAASQNGPGVDAIHIWAYPNPGSATPPVFLGVAAYGSARPDVATLYGANFLKSGYDLATDTLSPGSYRIAVFARSPAGGFFPASTIDITVRLIGRPYMQVDTPTNGSTLATPFLFAGWAIDTDSAAASGVDAVHLWAYPSGGAAPIFLGAASYGGYRQDVSRLFDPSACSGRFLPPALDCPFAYSAFGLKVDGLPVGAYRLVAFAHDSVTGRFDITQSVDVTVRPAGSAKMEVDAPTDGSSVITPFLFDGWAIDTDSATTSGVDAVHLWAYPSGGAPPIFLGAAAYGGYRWDVSWRFDSPSCRNRFRPTVLECPFGYSAFGLNVDGLPLGAYRLVAFAHSSVTGRFDIARSVTVTVRSLGRTLMAVDTPTNGSTVSTPFLFAGWAFDTDSLGYTSGVDAVHVWAYPSGGAAPIFLGVASYGGYRGDAAYRFGPSSCFYGDSPCGFAYSGFGLNVDSLPAGTYRLVAFAHSSVTGRFDVSKYVDVTVR